MRLLFVLSIILVITAAKAQESDSLKMTEWISKARKLMNEDANEGKKYLDTLRLFLNRGKENIFFEGEYHKFLAIYNYRKSNYDSALYHYGIANQKYETINNKLEQAKILVNISMVHNRIGKYKEAIDYATQALYLFEKLDDRKGVGVSLNIIGQVNFFNGQFTVAQDYFRKYLTNAILAGDSTEIASGFANLGSSFSKQSNFDSSLYYYKKALHIQLKLNQLYNIGNSMQNLATDFKEKALYDSALLYYYRAIEYYTKIDNKSGLSETYFNIGITQALEKKYTAAISSLETSLKLAREIGELYMQKENLLNISKNYERIGQQEKAFEFFKQYDVISDSILNENNSKFINELNARYETEKKEQQISMQKIMLEQQNARIQLNYIVILGLSIVVSLLIIIFILLRNRTRRKQELTNRDNEIKLREAHINASIQSQENERKRFAQDLHDGMGQLISSLKLLLNSIDSNSTIETRVAVVTKSESIMDEMQNEIRGIAFNLMPQTLIQHGLIPALKEMSLRLNSTGKISITVASFDMPERLPELHEVSFYRIIQEWTNNVMKYASASRIEIQLVGHDNEINLTIEDNGNGFDSSFLESGKGNGWRNILTRLKLINGHVEVDTAPGRMGTTLVISVDMPQELAVSTEVTGSQNIQ